MNIRYQCSKCLKLFDTEKEALRCENTTHRSIESIENPHYEEDSEYPNEIYLKMSDGKKIRFIADDYI